MCHLPDILRLRIRKIVGEDPTISSCSTDVVEFFRPAHLPGLELVSASYADRTFPLHFHPEYVVGAVVEGAERLSIRDASFVVEQGSGLLIHPGEPHANAAVGSARMGYRVFYIPPDLVGAWAAAPEFAEPVSRSPGLFRSLVATHRLLCSASDALEQQSAFLSMLTEITRGSSARRAADSLPAAKLRLAKLHLEAYFRDDLSLAALAEAVDLSPFHLLRRFRREFGLSPAAYRNLLRVMEARQRLLAGERIAQVAAEVGFVDQSHLTRQFRKVMGTTPGHYAQQ